LPVQQDKGELKPTIQGSTQCSILFSPARAFSTQIEALQEKFLAMHGGSKLLRQRFLLKLMTYVMGKKVNMAKYTKAFGHAGVELSLWKGKR